MLEDVRAGKGFITWKGDVGDGRSPITGNGKVGKGLRTEEETLAHPKEVNLAFKNLLAGSGTCS